MDNGVHNTHFHARFFISTPVKVGAPAAGLLWMMSFDPPPLQYIKRAIAPTIAMTPATAPPIMGPIGAPPDDPSSAFSSAPGGGESAGGDGSGDGGGGNGGGGDGGGNVQLLRDQTGQPL